MQNEDDVVKVWEQLNDTSVEGVHIPRAETIYDKKGDKENGTGSEKKGDGAPTLNMDGDFVALQQIKDDMHEKKKRGDHLTRRAVSFLTKLVESDAPEEEHVDESSELRDTLFKATLSDDINACKAAFKRMHELQITLGDPDMRDPSSNATAMHLALERNCPKLIAFFLKYGSQSLLMDEYNVTVNGISSIKNALHILTEKGNAALTKQYLDKIEEGDSKDDFLRKTVVVQIKGQRPRRLAPIHIAALLGNIPMVELFIQHGVAVDYKNDKHDTPILWATRWNHINLAEKLIVDYHADANAGNDKGSTPLHWAVRYGYPELTELLITKGKANVLHERKVGLGTPVVLASALGYANIVEILIKHGAKPDVIIRGGTNALHHACSMGHVDVVDILLAHDVDINLADENGDTPLIHAARGDHPDVVALLVQGGADLEKKNKENRSAWNFAMESEEEGLLMTLVNCFKKLRRMSRVKLTFKPSRTPLHMAAAAGKLQKLKTLLNLGVDPTSCDEIGNAFYHIAARYNYTDILEALEDKIDFDRPNGQGDTCLHIVCRHGHLETMRLLIKKTKLHLKNKSGETALHVAVRHSDCHPELITELVHTVIKAHNWSLVNEVDNGGNTALHLAAKAGNLEAITQLGDLNPRVVNKEGDSPVHVAAKSKAPGVLGVMIDVFRSRGKPVDLKQLNNMGETPLHICAKEGRAHRVRELIIAGADLGRKGSHGNTALHSLIMAMIRDKENKDSFLDVFDVICEHATTWWCIYRDIDLPDRESPFYTQLMRTAILNLVTELRSDAGLSVLDLACKLGARDFIEQLFQLTDVFVYHGPGYVEYDVTHVMPETSSLPRSSRESRDQTNLSFSNSKVGILEPVELQVTFEDQMEETEKQDEKGVVSLLDYITLLQPVYLAADILALTPFYQIAKNYWLSYQWMYVGLMVIQIVYMSCLSVYGTSSLVVPANTTLIDTNSRVSPFFLFLIWPAFLLLFEIYLFIITLYDLCRRRRTKTNTEQGTKWSFRQPLKIVRAVIKVIGYYLNDLTRVAFSSFVIAWYCLYVLNGPNQEYILAVSLVLGWLLTIVYTTGFQTVHSFTSMLGSIIIKDISRFLFIYIFVLLAFSMAFHALFQTVDSVRVDYYNPLQTMLFVFNLMIGNAETDFFSEFDSSGKSSVPLQVLYVIYAILATIILLNLLIAMMNDSYTLIREQEGTAWRVGSVALALRMERYFPFLPRMFGSCCRRHPVELHDVTRRWRMRIPLSDIRTGIFQPKTEVEKAIARLESRMNEVGVAQGTLETTLNTLDSRLLEIEDKLQAGNRENSTPRPSTARTRISRTEEMSRYQLRRRQGQLKMMALQLTSGSAQSGGEDNKGFQG